MINVLCIFNEKLKRELMGIHMLGRKAQLGICGIMVNMPDFPACSQCYSVGSGLVSGLKFPVWACGIFLSSAVGVFSKYSSFLSP